jgi:hypothetical protein
VTKLVTKFVSFSHRLSHCALTKSIGIVFRLALGDDIGALQRLVPGADRGNSSWSLAVDADKYRAWFKKAWQDHDYATIIAVAEKMPNIVLEEDPKLLMWYDQAITRMGDI